MSMIELGSDHKSSIVTIGEHGSLVTTSIAIAAGVGNHHSSVIKLIRESSGDLEEFGLLDFKSESTAGRPTEYAILNEQQSTLLLTYMRNNDVVRAFKKRLVKAFFDMSKQGLPGNLSRIQILQMAMESEQERIRLEEKVREDAPKVEFVDRYTDSTGLVSLTKAGQDLEFSPRKFISALERDGFLYRTGGALTPYQRYLDQGLFKMVNGARGGHGYSQTKVSTKGKAYFAQRYASEL